MDKERMAELEKIESHGAENGWVAPMTEEDRGQRKTGSSFHIFARCLSATLFHPQRQHGWSIIL